MTRSAASLALLLATAAAADELPINLQVQLLSKMSTYVSNFAPKGASTAKVLIVHSGTKEAPTRGANAIGAAITQNGKLGPYDAQVVLVPWSEGKKAIADEAPQVVFLAPELDGKAVGEIVGAVTPTTTLTISGVADHVKLGAVLGFALVEARPRVLINLKQAEKQKIIFLSGLVKHSIVVE